MNNITFSIVRGILFFAGFALITFFPNMALSYDGISWAPYEGPPITCESMLYGDGQVQRRICSEMKNGVEVVVIDERYARSNGVSYMMSRTEYETFSSGNIKTLKTNYGSDGRINRRQWYEPEAPGSVLYDAEGRLQKIRIPFRGSELIEYVIDYEPVSGRIRWVKRFKKVRQKSVLDEVLEFDENGEMLNLRDEDGNLLPIPLKLAPVQNTFWGIAEWETIKQSILNGQGQGGIMFTGDSITRAWAGLGLPTWQQYYVDTGLNPLNAAHGGDSIRHLQWRFANGELDGDFGHVATPFQPNILIMNIGANDFVWGNRTPESQAIMGMVGLLAQVKAKQPDTKVLLMRPFSVKDYWGFPIWQLEHFAEKLISLGTDPMVTHLDISEAMSDPATRQPDRVHLTPYGYEVWAAEMDPPLQNLLGE